MSFVNFCLNFTQFTEKKRLIKQNLPKPTSKKNGLEQNGNGFSKTQGISFTNIICTNEFQKNSSNMHQSITFL